jgi:hypothetical protein
VGHRPAPRPRVVARPPPRGAAGALAYWLDINPMFDNDGQLRAMTLAFVYHVVPVVLGCLACWWLEVRQRA